MATRFSKLSNGSVGLLAGLSLLITMLMSIPVPTKAADPEPDYLASFEACPEDIILSAGFVDVSANHSNAGHIDCIAYYGITKGTSPTTYSPDRPVIREHMALFLVRLARLVGINVPPAADTPFEDVGDLKPRSQEVISQIYQLGITVGATATTYAPARNVSRGEMALFLQRLMDLMVPAADGRLAFGHTPDDVNDNDRNFDVKSPFQDLGKVSHTVHAAVTQLYELGVASGLSSHTYVPDTDMSRATMAEFMAAILDHSNLRPRGVLVQVTPTDGREDFDIVMMISARDNNFAPTEDVVVDWFYTADLNGGLERDGTCDKARILGNGDCVWDRHEDEVTDLDGNIFDDFDATPGTTVSIYAWVGRRNGESFDEDTVSFSKAQARSEKDADSLFVQHDVPANAARIGGNGALIVDLDRRSSVEFTIQLLDEGGARLQREGVPIDIEVESRRIRVEAADATGGRPDPDRVSLGRDSSVDTTVLTDKRGRATFDLRGPISDERLDTVTIEADCCTKQSHRIAWSDGAPVLVAAQPNFELYQQRDGDRIEFTVKYDLLDQYGGTLRGTSSRYTGRSNTDLSATLGYQLYHARISGGDGTYTVEETPDTSGTPSITINRRGVTADIEIDIPSEFRDGFDFLVSIDAQIFSDRDDDDTLDSNEVRYVDPQLIVWIVKNASDEEEFDELLDRDFAATPGLSLEEVELYTPGRKFRTFFTLWSYDPNHKFQVNGDFVSVETFQETWEEEVDGIEDLDILIYGYGFSLVVIK